MEQTLKHLIATIQSRKGADASTSYVAKRFAKGRAKIAQKVGEEGVELALALALDDKPEIIKESADLFFHMLIALEDAGLSFEDVLEELRAREGVSGLEEKRRRNLT
jgi:phosphoribosyl-ATP pyrophosphohydrolase